MMAPNTAATIPAAGVRARPKTAPNARATVAKMATTAGRRESITVGSRATRGRGA
jgi:hypothetical protein